MTSTNKGGGLLPSGGGGSSDMEEASEAVAQIVDLVLKKIFDSAPSTLRMNLTAPRFESQMPVTCPNWSQCVDKMFGCIPCESCLGQLSWSAFQDFLRVLTGCSDLKNVFLLITPVEWPSHEPDAYKVHCYLRDSRKHKGVATVSREELQLIEQRHGPENYSIVKCTRPIQLADAVRNTPIKCQIFDVLLEASKVARTTWYKGQALRLSYRSSGPTRKTVDPAGIRSLRQPKIPVRMQRRLAWVRKPSVLQTKDSMPKIKAGAGRRDVRGRISIRQRKAHSKSPLGSSARRRSTGQAQKEERRQSAPDTASESQLSMFDAEEPFPAHLFFVDYANSCYRPLGPRYPMQDPPILPLNFSNAAFCSLEGKLRWPSACGAFLKLRSLVKQINERQRPRLRHLVRFFHLAGDLAFKMYIRRQMDFPGEAPSYGRRYMIDCYVFDDRREYIASIALLDTQLHALARLFPKARQNFRFVDDAFDLTPVPGKVAKWLEAAADAISRRRWYKFLGELTLKQVRPKMGVFQLPEDEDEADF